MNKKNINKSVNIITLGCAKNLVDSEIILKQLNNNGYKTSFNSNQVADIVIINTCGFINDAKEESIDTILFWTEKKRECKIKKLIVIGCLSERYKKELEIEIPDVDAYFGVNNLKEILENLNTSFSGSIEERLISTPKHYSYLKISEGCNRFCSFCAIPKIRGKHKSRTIESLIDEVSYLNKNGVKELMLIAQDLTSYGLDIYKKKSLALLLENIATKTKTEWIRLHYAYPVAFPYDVLDVINEFSSICRYIDIPLQHSNSRILTSMKRGINSLKSQILIDKIREKVDNIAIRTSFIVGYPGETKKEFNELMSFVSNNKFERLGVFKYSHEENTSAAKLTDNVSATIKQQRADELMLLQQEISTTNNSKFVGKKMKVIIDRKEGDFWIGRTEFDSPEVDNEVIIKSIAKNMKIGKFYNVDIIDFQEFDLIANF